MAVPSSSNVAGGTRARSSPITRSTLRSSASTASGAKASQKLPQAASSAIVRW